MYGSHGLVVQGLRILLLLLLQVTFLHDRQTVWQHLVVGCLHSFKYMRFPPSRRAIHTTQANRWSADHPRGGGEVVPPSVIQKEREIQGSLPYVYGYR